MENEQSPDRVAHYQAFSSCSELKFLHLRLRKIRKLNWGIRVGAREIKITQYADDTSVFLRNLESMSVLLDLLGKFETCSGLKINHAKSEAMWLRKWKSRDDTPFNVKWPKDSVFALGIHFSNSEKVSGELNFYEKLDVLQKTLNNWKRRKLTLLGKINIVKSVGLSKLIYSASLLPVPKNFCDQVNKDTFNFIWDNKIAKIKRNTIIGERKNRASKYDRFYVNEQSLKVHLDKAISPKWESGMDGYSQWSHITPGRLNLPLNL